MICPRANLPFIRTYPIKIALFTLLRTAAALPILLYLDMSGNPMKVEAESSVNRFFPLGRIQATSGLLLRLFLPAAKPAGQWITFSLRV